MKNTSHLLCEPFVKLARGVVKSHFQLLTHSPQSLVLCSLVMSILYFVASLKAPYLFSALTHKVTHAWYFVSVSISCFLCSVTFSEIISYPSLILL